MEPQDDKSEQQPQKFYSTRATARDDKTQFGPDGKPFLCKRPPAEYLQATFEESPQKRKNVSNNNVSQLFANPKGYAPLEDRPETHLPIASNPEGVSTLARRKYSSTSVKQDEEPGYKGGFAKPVCLNPTAMAQIDPQTRALY